MSDSPCSRSKRQKIDKHGRFAALERLKNLKGNKNKYEVNEIENVYEEVSEREYSERVLSRAAEDWLEDGGDGYVEDGREIFDDEEIEDHEEAAKKRDKSNKKVAKKRLRDVNKPIEGNASIINMFGSVGAKKKEAKVKLDEDDILAGILDEINPHESTANGDTSAVAGTSAKSAKPSVTDIKLKEKTEMALVKDYIASISKVAPTRIPNVKSETDDDAMLERLLKPSASNGSSKNSSNVRHSSKRPRSELSPTDTNTVIDSTSSESINHNTTNGTTIAASLKSEPQTPTTKMHDVSMSELQDDDMDFSMLDDEENQFNEQHVPDATASTSASSTSSIAASNHKAEHLKEELMKKENETYAKLLSNWENDDCNNANDADDELLGSFDVEAAQASVTSNVDGNSTLKFWYWDAYEDPNKLPGKLFLFGKMVSDKNPNEYKSVCVTVENVNRCLYLLPRKYILDPQTKQPTRKEVDFNDVYAEINSYFSHDFKCRRVTKHFAFNVSGVRVPQTCEYLQVMYNAKHPAPYPKKMFNSIEHIFGCNTNPLEVFLLARKIKGPTWLTVNNFQVNKVQQSTWCNLAITCSSAASISVANDIKIPAPPLVVVALYVRTALHPKTQTNEIVMITCMVNKRFSIDKKPPEKPYTNHFCGFTRPSSQNWPIVGMNDAVATFKAMKATKLDSERALLSWFLATFKNLDADLIVTHDASDCQLDVICDRLSAIKLPMWSRIGRLNLSAQPKKFKDCFVGRMICDVKSSAEELIRARSYDLNSLCQTVLKMKEDERIEVSNNELFEMYESVDGIRRLLAATLADCSYVLKMMCELNVLPLALQITNICGNLMSRTLQGGRSERNEYLLLHAFDEKDYIVPDKKIRESAWSKDETMIGELSTQAPTQAATQAGRKKPAYTGGLVLEPIKGFYDKYILLMDFNSLYPSIIQEYNICFTTIDQPDHEDDPTDVPDSSLPQGILPKQIRSLVDRRRMVKKLIVPGIDADLKAQYNIRQLALKLTANSMYGCLGFSNSRFYAKHLAALVTQKGRDILLNTKGIVTKLNFEVIYGDTDSIMINTYSTDYDEVYKIGNSIKQAVNKIYRHVELDIDGVYKYMLLLSKKKYAAVTVTKTKAGELECQQELKGLDIVRRDWSQISVIAGHAVLNELLSEKPLDERLGNIHARLEKLRDDINNDDIPLNLLTITKQLTKNPREYQKTQSMPHVQVALRMNSTKNKRYKRGDVVMYVICEDGTTNNPMQRAYHLDELKTESKLKIDKVYYLANQIHPVVSRLLKPIEGTDPARIAQCLGLDPAKYREAAQRALYDNERGESIGESIVQSNAEKYRTCERFSFKCVACKTENVIVKPFVKIDNRFEPVLKQCANKTCQIAPYHQIENIQRELSLAIRKAIRTYYDNWLICDYPNCNQSTRTFVHVTDSKGHPVCLTCKRGNLIKCYSEGDLYKQLKYFHFMFDVPKFEHTLLQVDKEMEKAFLRLREHIERTLKRSAYQNIKLAEIFRKMMPPRNTTSKETI